MRAFRYAISVYILNTDLASKNDMRRNRKTGSRSKIEVESLVRFITVHIHRDLEARYDALL